MNELFPAEALDAATLNLADGVRRDVEQTLQSEHARTIGAGDAHAVFALAMALAWRLQAYPMWERSILHDGAAALIRLNALAPEDGSEEEVQD
jgi:hypothetical protein